MLRLSVQQKWSSRCLRAATILIVSLEFFAARWPSSNRRSGEYQYPHPGQSKNLVVNDTPLGSGKCGLEPLRINLTVPPPAHQPSTWGCIKSGHSCVFLPYLKSKCPKLHIIGIPNLSVLAVLTTIGSKPYRGSDREVLSPQLLNKHG